jgi:hypothetical protein
MGSSDGAWTDGCKRRGGKGKLEDDAGTARNLTMNVCRRLTKSGVESQGWRGSSEDEVQEGTSVQEVV